MYSYEKTVCISDQTMCYTVAVWSKIHAVWCSYLYPSKKSRTTF